MTYEKGSENKIPTVTEGQEKALPEELPRPVYWPFFLAMGMAFIFWGLLTMWVILVAGSGIAIVALAGWIKILNHEKK